MSTRVQQMQEALRLYKEDNQRMIEEYEKRHTMNIFEIEEGIRTLYDSLLDEEGNIDPEVVEQLEQMTLKREEKIENTALYAKNIDYEIEALKVEKKKIEDRIRSRQKKQDWIKNLLSQTLEGQKFETEKARVTFRKSTQVQVDDGFIDYAKYRFPELVKTKVTESPDKTKIKDILKNGGNLEHCELITKQNISVR